MLFEEITEEKANRNVVDTLEGEGGIAEVPSEKLHELSQIVLIGRERVRREVSLPPEVRQEFADMFLHHITDDKLGFSRLSHKFIFCDLCFAVRTKQKLAASLRVLLHHVRVSARVASTENRFVP